VLAIGIAAFYWFRHEEVGPLKGLTQRNKLAHAGYTFLDNRYYLDHLYENVIVDGIRGPIARASYWVNQNVIDGVVNGAGRGAALVGRFAYDTVDQKVVDGAMNGLAYETGAAGEELRKVQGGRVQRYALILFAGVAFFSLALFLANVL
jgi:NADH-quinone oxidoreductase subunit L